MRSSDKATIVTLHNSRIHDDESNGHASAYNDGQQVATQCDEQRHRDGQCERERYNRRYTRAGTNDLHRGRAYVPTISTPQPRKGARTGNSE